MDVKNVFMPVDNFRVTLDGLTTVWNTPFYTPTSAQLSAVVVHVFRRLSTAVIRWFIPGIHNAYNNQLKGNLINTNNRRSVV